jgi:hypothetical protein
MTRRVYSSIAAYLAHWRVLRRAADRTGAAKLSGEEADLLNAMENLASDLPSDEREALIASKSSRADEHRRRRAEWRLERALTAAGWLQR